MPSCTRATFLYLAWNAATAAQASAKVNSTQIVHSSIHHIEHISDSHVAFDDAFYKLIQHVITFTRACFLFARTE